MSGRKVTAASLKQGIEIVNAKRRAVKRLAALRAADPAPISGLDALLVNQVFFYDDPLRFTDAVNKLCDELEERIKQGAGVFPAGTTRHTPGRRAPDHARRVLCRLRGARRVGSVRSRLCDAHRRVGLSVGCARMTSRRDT